MDDIVAYIHAQLDADLRQAWKDHGWWCPRCNCEAPPFGSDKAGWCDICGMDPTVEGPRKPFADVHGIKAPR